MFIFIINNYHGIVYILNYFFFHVSFMYVHIVTQVNNNMQFMNKQINIIKKDIYTL
jgi:hypothetical protein